MTPAAIIQKARAAGIDLALTPAGAIKATGDQAAVNLWLVVIREHKAGIIEVLKSVPPANEPFNTTPAKVSPANTAASWGWLVRYPDGGTIEVYTVPEPTRAEVLRDYPGAVEAEPLGQIRQMAGQLAPEDEAAIRAWLARIGEGDPQTIADVLRQCRADPEALRYFLERARPYDAEAFEERAAIAEHNGGLNRTDAEALAWREDDNRRRCSECANLVGRICRIAAPGGLVPARRGYEPFKDILRRCEGFTPTADDPDQRTGLERWPGLKTPITGEDQ